MNSNKIDELLSSKINTIKCPCCGYEYLPAEIFLPDYILGKPTDIVRTVDGKITYVSGKSANMSESYICDKCNKPFIVHANISFKTEYDSEKDFESDFSSDIYEDRITLKED